MEELFAQSAHGVFLRRSAIAAGYSDRDLHRAIKDHQLVRVRHGAYVAADQWQNADDVRRHLLHCHAVMLSHDAEVALSHISGAAVHGLRIWGADLSRVHVTRLERRAARKHHDVAYHEGAAHAEIVEVDGVPALSIARCAVGAAVVASVEAGLIMLDSAYDAGCTEQDLRAAYDEMRNWPGTARLQITLRLACAGSQSVGESRARFLFFAAGLPKPVLQYEVYDGNVLVGVTDFAWPEHRLLGEFDGKVKYGALLRRGEDPTDAVFREKVREDRLREATGWRVIRFTWADLETPTRTAERMRKILRRAA